MRVVNRLLAVLVAAAVGAAGVLVLVESTVTAGGWGTVFPVVHAVPGYVLGHAPNDRWFVVAAVAAVVVGVLLLAAQLRRRDRTRRVRTAAPQVHLAVTKRARASLAAPVPSDGRPLRRGPRIRLADGVDRVDRVLLTLAGVVLAAAGGLVLATAAGAFGARRRDRPVGDGAVRTWLSANDGWLWWAVAAFALAVLLLAAWWLLAQVTTRRTGRIHLDDDTRVDTRPLLRVVADELADLPGVVESRLSIHRRRRGPLLLATVLTRDDADLDHLWRRLEHTVVPHARNAAGVPHLPIRLTLDQEPPATVR